MSERVELTREQLYTVVWTKPIAVAAAELGMPGIEARARRLIAAATTSQRLPGHVPAVGPAPPAPNTFHLDGEVWTLRFAGHVCRVKDARGLRYIAALLRAPHRDLHAMAEAGTFRWDLLYRLDAMTLSLPPLRERKEDIAALAEHFLREANRENGRAVRDIEPRAAKILEAYRWPGNVRELRNVIDRAVVITRGDRITLEDLPERVRAAAPISDHAPQLMLRPGSPSPRRYQASASSIALAAA